MTDKITRTKPKPIPTPSEPVSAFRVKLKSSVFQYRYCTSQQAELIMVGTEAIAETRKIIPFGPGDSGYTVPLTKGEAYLRWRWGRCIEDQAGDLKNKVRIEIGDNNVLKPKKDTILLGEIADLWINVEVAKMVGGANCKEHANVAFACLLENCIKRGGKFLDFFVSRMTVWNNTHECAAIGNYDLTASGAKWKSFIERSICVDPWITIPQVLIWKHARNFFQARVEPHPSARWAIQVSKYKQLTTDHKEFLDKCWSDTLARYRTIFTDSPEDYESFEKWWPTSGRNNISHREEKNGPLPRAKGSWYPATYIDARSMPHDWFYALGSRQPAKGCRMGFNTKRDKHWTEAEVVYYLSEARKVDKNGKEIGLNSFDKVFGKDTSELYYTNKIEAIKDSELKEDVQKRMESTFSKGKVSLTELQNCVADTQKTFANTTQEQGMVTNAENRFEKEGLTESWQKYKKEQDKKAAEEKKENSKESGGKDAPPPMDDDEPEYPKKFIRAYEKVQKIRTSEKKVKVLDAILTELNKTLKLPAYKVRNYVGTKVRNKRCSSKAEFEELLKAKEGTVQPPKGLEGYRDKIIEHAVHKIVRRGIPSFEIGPVYWISYRDKKAGLTRKWVLKSIIDGSSYKVPTKNGGYETFSYISGISTAEEPLKVTTDSIVTIQTSTGNMDLEVREQQPILAQPQMEIEISEPETQPTQTTQTQTRQNTVPQQTPTRESHDIDLVWECPKCKKKYSVKPSYMCYNKFNGSFCDTPNQKFVQIPQEQ